MNKKHNKKRNSLIAYEVVVSSITEALLKNNKAQQEKAVKIIKKHFKEGTELFKEFRILNSIRKSQGLQHASISSILAVARGELLKIDTNKLHEQKTKLIHDINHNLGEDAFSRHIPDYKYLATIGLLVNEWKSESTDLYRMGLYENVIIDRMMSETKKEADIIVEGHSSGMARIITSLMMKRFNEKYSNLTNEQKSILRSFIFSETNGDSSTLNKKLNETRQNLIQSIEKYSSKIDDKFTLDKLNEVKTKVINERLDSIDENCLTRFLVYSQLTNEIESEEN